jgi:hypothetical protein
MNTPEPVIVHGYPGTAYSSRAALADVLILAPDRRDDRARFADLFARYPGLTLVAVETDAPRCLCAGLRDGTVVTLRLSANAPVDAAARALYAWWSAIRSRRTDARADPRSSKMPSARRR